MKLHFQCKVIETTGLSVLDVLSHVPIFGFTCTGEAHRWQCFVYVSFVTSEDAKLTRLTLDLHKLPKMTNTNCVFASVSEATKLLRDLQQEIRQLEAQQDDSMDCAQDKQDESADHTSRWGVWPNIQSNELYYDILYFINQ